MVIQQMPSSHQFLGIRWPWSSIDRPPHPFFSSRQYSCLFVGQQFEPNPLYSRSASISSLRTSSARRVSVAALILATLSVTCGAASARILICEPSTSSPSPSNSASQFDGITISPRRWWCCIPRTNSEDLITPCVSTSVHLGQTPVEGISSPMSSSFCSGDQP